MNSENGDMGTVEWLSYCILLACLFYWADAYLFPQKNEIKQIPATQVNCPNIQIKHFVGGDLKTGQHVVDGCAESLNTWSK